MQGPSTLGMPLIFSQRWYPERAACSLIHPAVSSTNSLSLSTDRHKRVMTSGIQCLACFRERISLLGVGCEAANSQKTAYIHILAIYCQTRKEQGRDFFLLTKKVKENRTRVKNFKEVESSAICRLSVLVRILMELPTKKKEKKKRTVLLQSSRHPFDAEVFPQFVSFRLIARHTCSA